jgi:hypothetical protein
MGWFSDQSEYARQREALRRRTNWESTADRQPNPSWERDEDLEPAQSWEPDVLRRPDNARPKPRQIKRRGAH